MKYLLAAASHVYGAAWECRRRLYALGVWRTARVGARVVSVGNLTTGGTGKTTLALHLGRRFAARGIDFAIVCRRYRPGPEGYGDEERMFVDAFGPGRVYAGNSKLDLAARAALDGRRLVLVDDGFSHWPLARDLNLVLLDAEDPWGGGKLLPAGRLREPRRALQRADAIVVTRVGAGVDPAPLLAAARAYAPGARLAAGRHRVCGVSTIAGDAVLPGARVWVVTATGHPEAVERSAKEAGLEIAGTSRYRDHHWFRAAEVRAERARARAAGATVLVTPKDAVRWPRDDAGREWVLTVAWEWLWGGEAIEAAIENGT